jgi:hypothetical protein
MGFSLRCAIATAAGDDEARRLIEAAMSDLPHVAARRFDAPFDGVLAGVDWQRLLEDYHEDPSRFAYADEDAAHDGIAEGVRQGLPALSRRFPGKPFAYVDIDCFGGTCLYEGCIVIDGSVDATIARSQRGHLELLARLGVGELAWHFPPFERGFLAGGEPSGPAAPVRREILGVVTGSVRGIEIERLGVILVAGLDAPWRVPAAGSTILLEAGAEDILLSCNRRGEAIEVGGRCHVADRVSIPLLDDLVELLDDFGAGYELTLAGFDRVAVRSWRSDR